MLHEAFAQALAKGMSADKAYVAAGYKESRSAASRLSANVNISARVSELVERSAVRAEIDIVRTLKELARLGTSDLRRAFDANGRLKRPEGWDDDLAAAISSVEVVTRNMGDGEFERVHKIKAWDKNSALDKIAKHLGMFVERHEQGVSDPLAELLRKISGRSIRPKGDG